MREPPTKLNEIAADLGINKKQLEARVKKYGTPKVRKDLKRDWVRLCSDHPRLLAKQSGHVHPEQYTASPMVALVGEPEAVSESEQQAMSDESRRLLDAARWRERQAHENKNLIGQVRSGSKQWMVAERDLSAVNAKLREATSLLER